MSVPPAACTRGRPKKMRFVDLVRVYMRTEVYVGQIILTIGY